LQNCRIALRSQSAVFSRKLEAIRTLNILANNKILRKEKEAPSLTALVLLF
jgi:hypothetical protein